MTKSHKCFVDQNARIIQQTIASTIHRNSEAFAAEFRENLQ